MSRDSEIFKQKIFKPENNWFNSLELRKIMIVNEQSWAINVMFFQRKKKLNAILDRRPILLFRINCNNNSLIIFFSLVHL